MDTIKWNKTAVVLLFGLITFTGFTQQTASEKLKQEQKKLEEKIRNTKELIVDTKNNQRITIAELALINSQISYRDELILNFSSQVRRLNQQMEENKSVIASMEEDLVRTKEQYKKMLFYAYKHRNTYNKLMFVFASKDFNTAYMRVKYLKQYGDGRKKNAEIIRNTQLDLEAKNAELEAIKHEKEGLTKVQEEEKINYKKDKEKQQEALVSLQREEKKLKQVLDDQEEKKRKLNEQIKNAIKEEIRKQQELAAKAEKKKPNGNNGNKTPEKTSGTGYTETPEIKLESTNFENNKGKLPWPVAKGEITQYFGKNPHPTLANVFTNNNGIDIGTTKNAKVRAVFEGKVSSIFVISGAGKAVMISHGSYRTVYANLEEVYVAKGQVVSIKQEIGSLLQSEGNMSEAHFEIWKISEESFQKQDPAAWLYK